MSNPRQAGDLAEWRTLLPVCPEHDTINIILLSTARFTPSAMVESIMIATETGTDAMIMASQKHGKPLIEYCGKHVLMSEVIAQLVMEAVTDSIGWELIKT